MLLLFAFCQCLCGFMLPHSTWQKANSLSFLSKALHNICKSRFFSLILQVVTFYLYNMRKYILMLAMLFVSYGASAQHADYGKMSSFVRQLTLASRSAKRQSPASVNREVCAFVRVADGDQTVLTRLGCRPLALVGDIFIASIPLRSLSALSLQPQVMRIEARQGNSLHMDTTMVLMGGARSHAGEGLPQAFTGKGVLVGVEDIGFDLTHPNFYDASATQYRIKRFWDFLSTDTIGSSCYVGADYTTEESIKAYAHSRDGLIQSHGTHTLGSAAGSGYDTSYRGMAPEADICLVSNIVSEDMVLIDSADIYKFTYATDALGFKYVFDYADSLGVPCVVSFSEGSSMDFRGDDQLYYEILDSITGPGRILVASAGNSGQMVTHVLKPAGLKSTEVSLISSSSVAYFSAKGRTDDYTLLFHLAGTDGQSVDYPLSVAGVYAAPDSLVTDTLLVGEKPYYITASTYPSCFIPEENVIEVILQTDEKLGQGYYAGFEVVGENVEVELFRGVGYLIPRDGDLGDNAYSMHSPGSAPSVIGVGATGYRTGIVNYKGEYCPYDMGTSGMRSAYSSVGPTFDNRIKPDVMAPGTNIISSYSSYYLENNPEASDINSDVSHFEFQGRTYAWNANSGTSMSTPVVAGAIALWLQAKPDLTPEQVMDVISNTSRHYDPALEYPNNMYGYGEVDAYAGLLYILGLSAIDGISSHVPEGVSFSMHGDGMLGIEFAKMLQAPVTVSVYSTSGVMVKRQQVAADGQACTIDLGTLADGVYAVQVDGSGITGSTLVRK